MRHAPTHVSHPSVTLLGLISLTNCTDFILKLKLYSMRNLNDGLKSPMA